jgi:hypothetical protein
MGEIKLWGSRGTVREGYVEINTGQQSTLCLVLGGTLMMLYILGSITVVLYLTNPFGSPWVLAPLPAAILVLHGVLRFLRRRGDDFFIYFRRQPPGSTPEVTYELKYRFKTVLTGAFGPQLLRIASYWQQLYPAGGGHVYQLAFRPDPPATMVHARYSEGIPLFESREPAVELLKVLKYDPAELEARIQEVTVMLPAPPAGDNAGRS